MAAHYFILFCLPYRPEGSVAAPSSPLPPDSKNTQNKRKRNTNTQNKRKQNTSQHNNQAKHTPQHNKTPRKVQGKDSRSPQVTTPHAPPPPPPPPRPPPPLPPPHPRCHSSPPPGEPLVQRRCSAEVEHGRIYAINSSIHA